MVFACDLKEENIHAFQRAKYISEFFATALRLEYVNTPGDAFLSTAEIQKNIVAFCDTVGFDHLVAIYNDYLVESGVLNFAKEILADIIRIPIHGRKGIFHFFLGSIGEDVSNHSILSVITFKK